MKIIKICFLIIFLSITGTTEAQKLQLKKLTPADVAKFKQKTKKTKIIPYIDKFVKNVGRNTAKTVVSKTPGSNLPDNIKKGTTTQESGKNCDNASVSYAISSEKLVPVDPTMSIKLGNVYDINLFRSGNYSTIPYQFLNDGLIYVGGKSTSNRDLTKVTSGTNNLDLQIALREFTKDVNSNYLTQKMSQNFELTYGISEKQLNAKLGAGYSDKLGNQAKLSSRLDLTSKTKNYTAIYKEENYTEELDMGGAILMQPTVPNENLVYVSEVVYGRLGFFEYSSSEDFMKFNLQSSASGNYMGASLSASLEVGALSSDTNGKIVTKLFGSTSDSQIPQTKDAFIAWANQRPSTNAMVPVGFVLKFVNDNATAYFVTSGTEPIEICSPKPNSDERFDVKIQLEEIFVEEVHEAPFDWHEDLYGSQAIASIETKLNGNKVPKLANSYSLWSRNQESAKKNGFAVGESINVNRFYELKRLTEEEVKNLTIVMGGKMYDFETVGGPRSYQCKNCDKPQNNSYQITYRMTEEGITSINNLTPNSAYKSITEKFILLNYHEGSSKVQARYRIYAKKY
jgi:hypothetical protein